MPFKPRPLKAYNGYDTKQASDDSAQGDTGPSLTVQAHAEDADINTIVKRFGITGKLPENIRLPEYGDYEEITDYRGALEAVKHANEQFMLIPAEIRAKFDNDPQKYLDYVHRPENLPEMRKLGLAKPEETRPPPPPPEPAAAKEVPKGTT